MNSYEVNQKGRRNVETELLQRGATLVTPYKTRKSLLHATDLNRSRTVELRIKTKRKGNWHTTIDEAKPDGKPPDLNDVRNFWVFVDMGGAPKYWIVPDWWIRNDIHEAHQQYLTKHGGQRPENNFSNHHSTVRNNGDYFMKTLHKKFDGNPLIRCIRGKGLLIGTEFAQTDHPWLLWENLGIPEFAGHNAIPSLIMKHLLKNRIITQICGNNWNVLKIEPPLIIGKEAIDQFINAMDEAVEWVASIS